MNTNHAEKKEAIFRARCLFKAFSGVKQSFADWCHAAEDASHLIEEALPKKRKK